MKSFWIIAIVYALFAILSFFSYKDSKIIFEWPDTLAIWSGLLSLYVLYKEYSNRNNDNEKSIYVQPILNEISSLREIEDDLDVIAKITVHDSHEKLQNDLHNIQKKLTEVNVKISSRLQKADWHCSLKNKTEFDIFLEKNIYPKCIHLLQNSLKDCREVTTFNSDIEELKDNILNLENLLSDMINKISDAL